MMLATVVKLRNKVHAGKFLNIPNLTHHLPIASYLIASDIKARISLLT